jgi:hypothetical protein
MPELAGPDDAFGRVVRITRFIWVGHAMHQADPVIGRLVRLARGAEALALVLFLIGVACILTGVAPS